MKTSDVQTILVPVDFSDLTQPILARALDLAGKFGATIHLVHVRYPFEYTMPAIQLAPFDLPSPEEAVAERKQQLKALARRNGLAPQNCRVVSGSPAWEQICQVAQARSADLIVMGTHGRSGLERFIEGTTAERVVQHAPCPVCVARIPNPAAATSNAPELRSILVPVDFSQSSFRALECAIECAERSAARLIVFHAVHFAWAVPADERGLDELAPLQEAAQREGAQRMDQFLRLAKFRGVRFETIIKIGSPVAEICALAQQREVDLIVTATHGRTGLSHFLIGSVAKRVVRHAPCSVLVLPSHAEARKSALNDRRAQADAAGTRNAPSLAKSGEKFIERAAAFHKSKS